MKTKLKSLLALVLSVLIGQAWAANPVATWTDFNTLTSGDYTLNENGNTISDGVLTIGSTPSYIAGTTTWDPRATGNAVVLAMRVTNLDLTKVSALISLKLGDTNGQPGLMTDGGGDSMRCGTAVFAVGITPFLRSSLLPLLSTLLFLSIVIGERRPGQLVMMAFLLSIRLTAPVKAEQILPEPIFASVHCMMLALPQQVCRSTLCGFGIRMKVSMTLSLFFLISFLLNIINDKPINNINKTRKVMIQLFFFLLIFKTMPFL